MINILIAGRTGYIGSYLNSELDNKYAIFSLDRTKQEEHKLDLAIDLTKIKEIEQFARVSDNFNVLIFLVGLAHSKGKGKDLHEFENVNSQTLTHLLTALKKVDKIPRKIIFASTISVYGERYDQNSYIETLEPNPFSPYAVTKLQAERYLLDNFGSNSWILRFAPVYSPNFLLNINRRTKIGGRYYKVGNGTKRLSLCNIENINTTIEGIIAGVVPSGVYNVSDPVAYSYNDLVNHQGASFVFHIPVLAIRLLYILGKITNNVFLKENSTKLITDNIFPSDKIQKYIRLNSTISDLKTSNA